MDAGPRSDSLLGKCRRTPSVSVRCRLDRRPATKHFAACPHRSVSAPFSSFTHTHTPMLTCTPLPGVSNILFRLQNQIQALVITSSLIALVPPSPSPTSSTLTPRSTLPQKIHALLTADLLAPASASHTHLSDLSSLVLGALPVRPSDDQVEKLKSAISRVLRTEDPVWGLLLGRLAQALVTALDAPRSRVPTNMATGRVAGTATGQATAREKRTLVVKGFEGETMEQACGEVLVGLEAVKGWVEDVWREVVMKKL